MAPAAPDPPHDLMLDALRQRLALPGLEFAEPPVRVTGGYETHIYALRLAGAPPELSGPLILRLFVRPGSAIGALVEYDVYQFLARAGFPAPFAHHICDDGAGLGGPWILMDRAPGKPLMSLITSPRVLLRSGRLLAELHARLHRLDPAPLAALRPKLCDPQSVRLEALRPRVAALGVPGFREGLDWLVRMEPAAIERASLTHGDFHPLNILYQDGVTGLIDWSNVAIGDPARDVAATRFILLHGPVAETGIIRALIGAIRRLITASYVRNYRRLNPIEPARLDYYEADRCLRALVGSAEQRIAAAGAPSAEPLDPYPWDLPGIADSIIARFQKLTGVVVDFGGQ